MCRQSRRDAAEREQPAPLRGWTLNVGCLRQPGVETPGYIPAPLRGWRSRRRPARYTRMTRNPNWPDWIEKKTAVE